MLYWFFVKGFGWIARRRMGPTAIGLENVPREGGAIIAANHLAVIDDALIPITCPRMVHFMGKAEYFEGKGIKAGSRMVVHVGGSVPRGPFRRLEVAGRVGPRP